MKIIVYGSQEFGKTVKDLLLQCDYNFAGFIDDYNTGDEILGDFEKVTKKYSSEQYKIVIAIGYKDLSARWEVYQRVHALGYQLPTIIHPKAYVRDPTKIGQGTMIMAGAIVDTSVNIEPLVVAWPGVVINHDCTISANTFISPNATICGAVHIGKNTFIGAGAVIVDHTTVPPNSFIKAGTVYVGQR